MIKKVTYKSSGVDIVRANQFIRSIKSGLASTKSKAVIEREGSFGALYAFNSQNKNTVLVSSTDGVGTKLLIAQMVGKHDTVGIDLVAMNVNDILCVGAKPLFFLDYIACGQLKPKALKGVMKGIVEGCRQSGLSLIGGETAEMPDLYGVDEYDLAGFAVGWVEKEKIIDGSKIKAGDVLIGLPSSGLHSNGFSLVRKVFSQDEQRQMAAELLRPTKIYVKEVEALLSRFDVKAIAHMTGGAYYEKLTKILPKGKCFKVFKGSWPVPFIFQNIQKRGKIGEPEMFRTFNMGIGLALVFARKDLEALRRFLDKEKIEFYEIGEVVSDKKRKLIL